MPDTDEQLKQLHRKRGAVKRNLTIFNNFVKQIETLIAEGKELDGKCLAELKLRLEKVESILVDYEEIQLEIEFVCLDDALEKEYEERDNFTNLFSATVANAKTIFNKHNPEAIRPFSDQASVHSSNHALSSNHSDSHSATNLTGIKLPTISLPKFNGNYNNWLEYKDIFESLIHSSDAINKIQKYHYLRASLEGDALKVIQSLEFSSSNYDIAWDILCKRYNNSRLLIQSHIRSLFEIKAIEKETSIGLRNLHDSIYKHLRALEALQQPVEHWDSLLIFIISSKLDKNGTREWERHKITSELPSLAEMQNFLEKRAEWLENLEMNHSQSQPTQSKKESYKTKQCTLLTTNEAKCNYCKQGHLIYKCEDFLKLDIKSRINKVNQLQLCSNCLCTGHIAKHCRSGPCRKCKNRHNTLLHTETVDQSSSNATQVSFSCFSQLNQVLLSTAVVLVSDHEGRTHEARLLLDSASQSNYISSELCRKLNLKVEPTNISILGINMSTSQLNSKCQLTFKSMHNDFSMTISCFLLPKITDKLPLHGFSVDHWNLLDLKLADNNFNVPSEVDILVGAGHFWNILRNRQLRLGKHLPILQDTVLGYIISGSICKQSNKNYPGKTICNFSSDIEMNLQRFWEMEECSAPQVSQEDMHCEQHFIDNVTKTESGQFMVRLPFKHETSLLGDSKTVATKRFLQLEKRFHSDEIFHDQYSQFMKEYEQLGHMSRSPSTSNYSSNDYYFLPHHGVIRNESSTTKLRVVFDGSAVTDTGWSLNDLLMAGPNIINDFFSVLIRFRQYPIVVSADVRMMFRQILLHPNDRKFQQILWRETTSQDISIYTLNTVTYGMVSAPYLAIRCLKQVALESKEQHPIASKIIANDFYVDDLITGFYTEEDAINYCKEISDILLESHFHLRKWNSNNSSVLQTLHNTVEPTDLVTIGNKDQIKTLGIYWKTDSDKLTFKIKSSNVQILTKRAILAEIATIFDPYGLISPCVLVAKLLIQKLWSLHIDWDESLPKDLATKWVKLRNQLLILNQLQLQRQAVACSSTTVELHGFCDASQAGYGACIYLRSIDAQQNICVQLLCAKTKVSPLKPVTIPRLELCSALLLAELVQKVTSSLTIDLKSFLWSDSQVFLCWLKLSPNLLQPFVGNRVAKIQALTDVNIWRYVNTKENPADLTSRGVLPETLLKSQLWFKGPSWLSRPSSCWPNASQESTFTDIPEIKKNSSTLTTTINVQSFPIERFSSLSKLKQVMAYCLRFLHNCRNPGKKQSGPITNNELIQSMKQLAKLAQAQDFQTELNLLDSRFPLKVKTKLLKLSPFIDEDGLLRVGGRLKNSNLQFEAKHPVLLSGKHHLTRLIFEYNHLKLCHAPPQLLLATVRQEFWPTSGMNIAKKIVRECVKCFRFKPKTENPLMAHLPTERVTVMSPFSITGIDYAGPYFIKDKRGRGCKLIKAYICLFICFASKAIHLELVTSLTTDDFIAALRRFSSRRGKPNQIYSDNGTNFVGANRELQSLYDFLTTSRDEMVRLCAGEGIIWHFIPPNSPHFGGLWESGVKSVQYHLSRSIGESKLIYEEFNTVLIQIEAILNSRPLYPLSSDPNDLQPLTPSHLLIGRPLLTVPDPSLKDIPVGRLTRYQVLQQIIQSFWRRWSNEYLTQLQQRNKWNRPTSNLIIGTLVVLKHDNLPACSWPLGRIIAVHPDKEGVVRVVTVKTAKGSFKRSVTKVFPLPLPKNDDISENKQE